MGLRMEVEAFSSPDGLVRPKEEERGSRSLIKFLNSTPTVSEGGVNQGKTVLSYRE